MDMIELFKASVPEENSEELIMQYLDTAQSIILARRFPFGTDRAEVEPQYKGLQLRIAIDLYNKRGAEGEKAHSENGVSRTYESSWVSQQLLDEIVPKAEVL
jgi:hypothetical protein